MWLIEVCTSLIIDSKVIKEYVISYKIGFESEHNLPPKELALPNEYGNKCT